MIVMCLLTNQNAMTINMITHLLPKLKRQTYTSDLPSLVPINGSMIILYVRHVGSYQARMLWIVIHFQE